MRIIFLLLTLLAISPAIVGCQPGANDEISEIDEGEVDESELDELLAIPDELTLCDKMYKKILYQSDKFDITKCSQPEQVVMLVFHATGIIDNGGFQYCFEGTFEGDPDYTKTAAAFHAAKLDRCGAAVDEALKLFPNSQPPTDRDERLAIFQAAPEKTRDAIDQKFWGQSEQMTKFLATYIRENRAAFKHLFR